MNLRRFRPRFTVHRLMVAVAVAALVMGAIVESLDLCHKAASYRARATEHAGVEMTLRAMIASNGDDSPIDISPGPGRPSRRFTARAVADWQAALSRKYDHAAQRPWIPVESDPPEPE